MAKINWNMHCQSLLSGGEQSAKARKAYAEQHNLNDNSFRRELTKYKKSTPESAPIDDQKSDQHAKNDQRKPKQAPNKKPVKNQRVTKKPTKADKAGTSDHKKSDQSAGTPRAHAHVAKNRPTHVVNPDGTMRFAKGNTVSVIHGAFAEKLFLNADMEALADITLDDMHRMSKARFAMIEMIRTDLVKQVQFNYENGNPSIKEVFDGGEIIRIPMTFEEAISGAMLVGHKEQTKLYADVMKAEQTQAALVLQSHNTSPLSKADAIDETGRILELQENGELTPIEAGYLLEGKGITLPFTLKVMIEKEIESIEPPANPDEEGLTPEQIEAIKLEAIKFESEEDEKVSRNNEELAKLMAGLKDG